MDPLKETRPLEAHLPPRLSTSALRDREPSPLVGDRWRSTYVAWQEAEQRSDPGLARVHLLDLAESLLSESTAAPASTNLALLHVVGQGLERHDLLGPAYAVHKLGRSIAEERRDRYGVLHFGSREARTAVGLLDFRRAARLLRSILGLAEPEQLEEGPQLLASLDPPATGPEDLRLLKIEMGLALGRYLGAVGRFGSCLRTLRATLEVLSEGGSPNVSAEDVRLLVAETHLDRGDFAVVETMVRRGHPDRREWKLLSAALSHARGNFSEADRLLAEVSESSKQLQHLGRAAAQQRIHVLASLNRLDEAEAMVAASAATTDGEKALPLLDARRSVAQAALELPPSSRELLPRSKTPMDGPLPPGPELDLLEDFGQRTRERLRDDYGHRFNQTLLEIHRGRLELAALFAAELQLWIETVDSPWLAARQDHLWALLYYYSGDYDAAAHHTEAARAVYADMDCISDEWAMRRVLGWVLRRQNAEADRIESNHREAQRLQDLLLSRLTFSDRVLCGLNKWSTVDEEVSAICQDAHRTIERSRGRLADLKRRCHAAWARHRLLRRRSLGSSHRATPAVGSLPENDAGPRDLYRLALGGRASPPNHFGLPCWALPLDLAIVQYVSLPDRLEIFLGTRRGWELLPKGLTTTRPQLWELTKSFLRRLGRRKKWSPGVSKRRVRDASGHLQRIDDLAEFLAIPQIVRRLPSEIQRLAVVADGVLVHVPFGALPISDRPLVSRFSIVVIPSLEALPRSRALTHGTQALGVAVTRSSTSPDHRPLKEAVSEIETIGRVGLARWSLLVDDQARLSEVISGLANARIAHFACHGDYFPDRPDDSGLLLEDGWLTVRDLRELETDLELVVLASCWGASTATLPGGARVGLPFALLDSGARAVLASLWEVSDTANGAFVRELYSQLEQQGPIEAVAEAQRRTFEAGSDSAHWSGYTVVARGLEPRNSVAFLLRLTRFLRTNLRHIAAAISPSARGSRDSRN